MISCYFFTFFMTFVLYQKEEDRKTPEKLWFGLTGGFFAVATLINLLELFFQGQEILQKLRKAKFPIELTLATIALFL